MESYKNIVESDNKRNFKISSKPFVPSLEFDNSEEEVFNSSKALSELRNNLIDFQKSLKLKTDEGKVVLRSIYNSKEDDPNINYNKPKDTGYLAKDFIANYKKGLDRMASIRSTQENSVMKGQILRGLCPIEIMYETDKKSFIPSIFRDVRVNGLIPSPSKSINRDVNYLAVGPIQRCAFILEQTAKLELDIININSKETLKEWCHDLGALEITINLEKVHNISSTSWNYIKDGFSLPFDDFDILKNQGYSKRNFDIFVETSNSSKYFYEIKSTKNLKSQHDSCILVAFEKGLLPFYTSYFSFNCRRLRNRCILSFRRAGTKIGSLENVDKSPLLQDIFSEKTVLNAYKYILKKYSGFLVSDLENTTTLPVHYVKFLNLVKKYVYFNIHK